MGRRRRKRNFHGNRLINEEAWERQGGLLYRRGEKTGKCHDSRNLRGRKIGTYPHRR